MMTAHIWTVLHLRGWAIGLLMACANTGVQAQTVVPLVPGQTINVPYGGAPLSLPYASTPHIGSGFGYTDQRPVTCYSLETLPGQVIGIRSVVRARNRGAGIAVSINIAIGDNCRDPNAVWIGQSVGSSDSAHQKYYYNEGDYRSGWRNVDERTTYFIAGGGRYLIAISQLYYGSISYSSGFELSAVLLDQVPVPPAAPYTAIPILERIPAVREIGYAKETQTPTASTSSTGSATRRSGERFRDCETVCPEMVVVPAGNFMMGSLGSEEGHNSDEGPVHQVTFKRPFAMGRTEVTTDEWQACVADRACAPASTSSNGRRPVVGITWAMARTYADWLSRKTGQRYFLPSEAEWEYATRAGTTTPWNTGDAIITDDANILNQFKQPVPVGGFPPNAFGLHDMHGNVYEWVLDCHEVGYFGSPTDGGAVAIASCPNRVLRGGGFRSEPKDARSAGRDKASADHSSMLLGLRVARAM